MRRLTASALLAGLQCVCLAAGPAAADDVPLGGGWVRTEVVAAGRRLAVARPALQPDGDVLTVVIEGDGRAHDRRGRPTGDPTPKHAIGLEIAQAWPASGPRAWLGRLCQYTAPRDPACRPADWTSGRFSAVALTVADGAIDELKSATGARRVRLVGWSGGGTLAMLVASGRADVAGVVTLAAPLDLDAWTRDRGLSPLEGADPARLATMPAVPQVHLFGAFDPVVPPRTALDTARRLAGNAGHVEVWPERHACCWARRVGEIAALSQAASDRSASAVEPPHEPSAAP